MTTEPTPYAKIDFREAADLPPQELREWLEYELWGNNFGSLVDDFDKSCRRYASEVGDEFSGEQMALGMLVTKSILLGMKL